MKQLRKYFHCTKKSLLQIHLVDKCLILFMCILLAQSAFSLFHSGTGSKGTGDIDIIIRTSSAAIFGYFISANFIRRFSKKENAPNIMADTASDMSQEDDSAHRLQIIAATTIGLFCLSVLLIQRNFPNADLVFINSTSATATITQFRDFVSGCVGFLIGTPTHRDL